ncbi:MAG: hypothetical protein KAJ18_08680 [Candidatus Omnitrophica bacterium]|nr:hypothetical protein [Candidatus Omnitrophota bacterium]
MEKEVVNMHSFVLGKYRQCEKGKQVFFAVLFLFWAGAFFFVKSQGPGWIETAYHDGQFEWLNEVTKVKENQPLDFYLGRAEETFFGPLRQMMSGLLLTAIVLVFLKNAKARAFGAMVFAYLVLTKIEVLFYPPYGDAIGGPFSEAIWLARHGFDYVELFHQDGYALGGPKVYFFSIFPMYIAFLLKLIPWGKAFLVVNHLAFFAFAAITVTALRESLSQLFPKNLSSLVALMVLFQPLFQVQTEAINMEMASVFLIVLSAWALGQKRIHLSGIMLILAVLVKGSAVFGCAAFFLVSLYLFFGKTDLRFQKKVLGWGVGLMIFSGLKLASKFLLNDQHVSVGMVALGKGWPSLIQMKMFYFFIWICIGFIGYYAFCWWRARRGGQKTSSVIRDWYPAWVMLVYGVMWFVLFFNFYAVSPRYRLGLYPFFFLAAFYVFAIIVRPNILRKLILIAGIAVSLSSAYGSFYAPMKENDHVLLERSLEYRTDLEMNRRVVKVLEEKYSGFLIGAPFIIAQSLALPELGYITKDLDVMIYGFPCKYGGLKEFSGWKNLNLSKTVYVGVSVAPVHKEFSYPVSSQDRIIENIQYGDKKAVLFMGGVGIQKMFLIAQILRARRNQ